MSKQPHIQLDENDIATFAILVGDPARVSRVGLMLDKVKELAFNREYKSISGFYNEVKVLVISTGMGGVSTAIAVEELAMLGVKVMIRVGSCGAMQKGIGIGDLVISTACVRDEGTSKQYSPIELPAVPDLSVLTKINEIAKNSNLSCYFGITRSHDSFYIDNNDEVEAYWSSNKVIGADMETAALFIVGFYRNIKTASILNNVVCYMDSLEDGVNDFVDGNKKVENGEKASIKLALDTIYSIDMENKNDK